jgi:hypothetical protein
MQRQRKKIEAQGRVRYQGAINSGAKLKQIGNVVDQESTRLEMYEESILIYRSHTLIAEAERLDCWCRAVER